MATGIANVKGKNEILELLTTTTAPTESGGVITISTSNISGTPKVNSLLAYIDSDNISALYKITTISSGTATLSLVGNVGGGGGKQLYQHNIFTYNNDAQYNAFGLNFISEDSTPLSSITDLKNWLKNNFITLGNNSPYSWKFCPANGQYLSGTNYRKILGLTYFNKQNEIYVYYVDGNNVGQSSLGSGYLKFTDIVLPL